MESSKQKGLAHLPTLVYTEGLLPLLPVNEVLRLRRVCKPLKSICDEHLRKQCPSKSMVCLRDSEEEPEEINIDSVSKFLEFDSTSSIKIPSQHFYLDYGKSFGQLSLNLSTRYGTQIKHLSLEKMELELPFVSNTSQFHFFQNLTNLSSLTLGDMNLIVNDDDLEMAPETLPTCFKNNLKKFEVSQLYLKQLSDANKFWEMVGLFEKLENFRFPDFIKEGTRALQGEIFENCCKLIGRKSSNIKCLDLLNLNSCSVESLKSFSELSLRNQIKWENVPAWILKNPLYLMACMPNANMFISTSEFLFKHDEGLCFPNLVSIDVSDISDGLNMSFSISWGRPRVRVQGAGCTHSPPFTTTTPMLSPSVYPALRILKVTTMTTSDDNCTLSKAWKYLTNLEEVSFQLGNVGDMRLSSETFVGQPDTKNPPFLLLKKLKKLSIHIPHDQGEASSIDDAFHKAFRLMPLKEFKITSQFPIRSVVFNKEAILALGSPGPFIENIEKFSFRTWSMGGVTDDEFRQLGRTFPNNQAL